MDCLKSRSTRTSDETRTAILSTLPCANVQYQDDWRGISDQKRRKKLQNRLNQRALRERRKVIDTLTTSSEVTSYVNHVNLAVGQTTDRSLLQADECRGMEVGKILRANPDSMRSIMQRLERLASGCCYLESPRTDLLLHVIQFNFSKALIENISVLGLTSEDLDDEAISPFHTAHLHQGLINIDESSLPHDLQPTAVQRTVPHHPWLDLLPIPGMRDNLICAGETYDEEQLCLEMKGHGGTHSEQIGIVVWRDPWDSSGWEVSESFARNWSWVIRGCEELFRSTNFWRTQRGERPLFRLAS